MANEKGQAIAELTLTEIALRIRAHLLRMENAQPQDGKVKPGRLFWSGAHQVGAYVSVCYINYQGGTNLTRAEAAHYLRLLDSGKEGSHYVLFRKDPPPEPEKDVIRFHVLARDTLGGPDYGRFFLYGVTKRTKTRVYGKKVAGLGYAPSYIERSRVIKTNATVEDLAAAEALRSTLTDELNAARTRFREGLNALKTNEEG